MVETQTFSWVGSGRKQNVKRTQLTPLVLFHFALFHPTKEIVRSYESKQKTKPILLLPYSARRNSSPTQVHSWKQWKGICPWNKPLPKITRVKYITRQPICFETQGIARCRTRFACYKRLSAPGVWISFLVLSETAVIRARWCLGRDCIIYAFRYINAWSDVIPAYATAVRSSKEICTAMLKREGNARETW